MLRSKKTQSLEDLTKHQQRIRSIVSRINQYKPDFYINRNYRPEEFSVKIKKNQRRSKAINLLQYSENQDWLFQQNISLIQKIQSVGPRINTQKFPEINLEARQNRKFSSCSSLSLKKYQKLSKKSQIKKFFQQKNEDQIFEENMKMIQKLQNIEPKIKCWQQKIFIKTRKIHQKRQQQKRKQILQKFKQIQKEIKGLSVRKNAKQISLLDQEKQQSMLKGKQMSPYLKKEQVMKCTTDGETAFQRKKINKKK